MEAKSEFCVTTAAMVPAIVDYLAVWFWISIEESSWSSRCVLPMLLLWTCSWVPWPLRPSSPRRFAVPIDISLREWTNTLFVFAFVLPALVGMLGCPCISAVLTSGLAFIVYLFWCVWFGEFCSVDFMAESRSWTPMSLFVIASSTRPGEAYDYYCCWSMS